MREITTPKDLRPHKIQMSGKQSIWPPFREHHRRGAFELRPARCHKATSEEEEEGGRGRSAGSGLEAALLAGPGQGGGLGAEAVDDRQRGGARVRRGLRRADEEQRPGGLGGEHVGDDVDELVALAGEGPALPERLRRGGRAGRGRRPGTAEAKHPEQGGGQQQGFF